MERKEKLITSIKLGLAIQKVIGWNKKNPAQNAVTSLRKLAAASDVEYAIIQKISAGKKDPQFSTLLAIADGLNLTITELLVNFETISNQAATLRLEEINKMNGKKKKE